MSFLLALGALVWLYLLSLRVAKLENRLEGNEVPLSTDPTRAMTGVERAALSVSSDVSSVTEGAHVSTRIEEEVVRDPGTDMVSRFFRWIRQDFMMKVGAFLLLCALGWFVSYAFAHNWIGPVGRITLGLLLGAGFLVLGAWRMTTQVHQGAILTVLGSTTILITTYAARELYGFFTPLSALLLMFLSIAFVAYVSVRFSNRNLALSGLILAAIAPEFTLAGTPDVIVLFAYLSIVVTGTLWVVYLRSWSILTFAALVIVFLHGMPYLVDWYYASDTDIALLYAFFFTAVFFIANIFGLMANAREGNRVPHILIAIGTGLYLILWITGAASPEWQSLLYVMWMLVFSLGSFIVYRALHDRVPFYIYGGTSLVLLGAATAAELNGAALTIAYTSEVALLVLLTLAIVKNTRLAAYLSLLFALPLLLSIEHVDSVAWQSGIFHRDFFALLFLTVLMAGVAYALRTQRDEQGASSHDDVRTMSTLLATCASFGGLLLIWLVFHAGLSERVCDLDGYYSCHTVPEYERATMLTLILYTLIGLSTNIIGSQQGKKGLRIGGAVLLGFVICHLLFIDVWNMELMGRIITFGAIGVLLIGTAFIRRTHNETTS